MKKILLLLLISIFSCQQEYDSFVTYEFLHQEFEYSTRKIKNQITENLRKDKLTKNELKPDTSLCIRFTICMMFD